MPKVSVIMGALNASARIDRSINSILEQTFLDWEFIICDDGSNDDTYERLLEWQKKDSRIIPIKNEKNLGLAHTLNNCLKYAKGEYVARMDDDDISHADRFAKQVAFLDTNPEYMIVGTSRNFYDNTGIWGTDIIEGDRSKLDIYLGRSFVHPSVMLNKKALIEVGGYSTEPEIGRTEDFDLWCKMYAKGYKGYNLGDILLDYYEARDSYNKRKYKYRICEYKLKKKWRKELNISWKYFIFTYRPLVVGLLPRCVLMMYHKYKYNI